MRFALRRLPHVRLCTLRQIVLAQSQWHPFYTCLYQEERKLAIGQICLFYLKQLTRSEAVGKMVL